MLRLLIQQDHGDDQSGDSDSCRQTGLDSLCVFVKDAVDKGELVHKASSLIGPSWVQSSPFQHNTWDRVLNTVLHGTDTIQQEADSGVAF
jgi:hypothetical protein